MNLAELSTVLFLTAVAGYVVSMVSLFWHTAAKVPNVDGKIAEKTAAITDKIGIYGTVLFFVVHVSSIVTRGLSVMRWPLGNMFEYGSAIALVAVGLGFALLYKKQKVLLSFVLFMAIVVMFSSLLLFTEASPLQPALRSYWLIIHVTAISTSSAVLMVGFVFAALYLVKNHTEKLVAETPEAELIHRGIVKGIDGKRPATIERDLTKMHWYPLVPFVVVALFSVPIWGLKYAGINAIIAALLGVAVWYVIPVLPNSDQLDTLSYRVHMFGFPLFTFGIIFGAIWAQKAWGRYWGWDPKETASLMTWLIYATYLHARATRGWRGARAAWIVVGAFTALAITYFAVNLVVSGLHSYSGV